ncbi:MAG TPA: sulfurtransferase TusA family protein [Nitrospiria bacterium]
MRTKQSIDKLTAGQVLEMTATDPGSVADMKAWSNRTGHALLNHRQDNGKFIFLVRKDS